jgi:Family of unknown function (DUF5686)/CarboxypepD_reg-like domain
VRRFSGYQEILFLFAFSLAGGGFVQAQETVVQGKVTEAASGNPIPFVNIYYKGTSQGTTTDFDGNFLIRVVLPGDSLVASSVGYRPRFKAVKKGVKQVINFQLDELQVNLQEIAFNAGENPAFEIMRKVMRNKSTNDKRKLIAYEYNTYTKIEIDADNLTDAFRRRKVVKKITQVLDSIERMAGEDGKPILPLFITETISKVYYRDNPSLKKEVIEKSKINGVGIEDGTLVTQFVGSSFQEYNFYQNWLNIVAKEFISPLADGWRAYYNYDLTDSVYLGEHFCYRLDFYPKSKQDLAFSGTLWITKQEYALKQIDATMDKSANINFVEKIKIQQELERTPSGAWLPVKNRVLVDVSQLTPNSAGMLAKFYTSNKNFVTNEPRDTKFFDQPIVTAEDARMFEDEKYWDTLRYEPLSHTEKNVYKMIDTLQNIPIVRTYTDIIKTFIDGYYDLGKVEVGPYLGLIGWNNKEGFRVQGGIRTTERFSKRWSYSGTLAYGFKDSRIKYSIAATRILSREHWTTASIRFRSDIARLGVDDETLADNPLFLVATRWGFFRRGYYFNEGRAAVERQLFKGFTQRIIFRHWTFDPTFNFGYLQDPTDQATVFETFQASEVSLETRYGRDELFIQNGNERISIGGRKWPVVTFRYTHGIKGIFGSDFTYDKMRILATKRFKAGPLGVGYVTVLGEYVFNTLPYPLLAMHLGNQSSVYSTATYNLMDYGEFISDHYVSVRYRQYLEGFLLNRIPLVRRLKWRLLGTASVIEGGMRKANQDLISKYTVNGEDALAVGHFTHKPYVELGYGVENIFKFLRVDFVHRMSYLDSPNARKFGVLFTAQFKL